MLGLGIVGLPNVGKSTLFNALTSAKAAAENFPFCTVEPNHGVVPVPDDRLARLAAIVHPERVIPTSVEFVDIAGLVAGASRGEGLGNQFLSHVREVDAIVHVIRCFDDPDVTHVAGGVDPVRDHDIIATELALADLAAVERQLERAGKSVKSGDKQGKEDSAFLERALDALNGGVGVRAALKGADDARRARRFGLLTAKPVVYAANVNENALGDSSVPAVEALEALIRSQSELARVIKFSARFEAELAEFGPAERTDFLESAGIGETGLERVVVAGYRLLDLETFLTVGPKEVRAWTIPAKSSALEAAGAIHSDFQRGFIRAETIHTDDFLRAGSYKAAREQGWVRSEGRDYVVKDGDILLFRFNV